MTDTAQFVSLFSHSVYKKPNNLQKALRKEHKSNSRVRCLHTTLLYILVEVMHRQSRHSSSACKNAMYPEKVPTRLNER